MKEHIESIEIMVGVCLIDKVASAPLPDLLPGPEFLHRARAAAIRAADTRRLAAAAHEVGFKPLPLPDYVSMVAAKIGVSLQRLAPELRGHLLDPWVQLARDMSLPTERVRLLIRAFVANREGLMTPALLARGERSSPRRAEFSHASSEQEYDSALARIEASYSPEIRKQLTSALDLING